jgi:hypothetical protein
MSNMNLNDLELGLKRLLEVKSGEAEPTLLERVQLKPSSEWDDDEWEFANQRGLIPPNEHNEYVRRQIERRHQQELAALTGGDVAPNFTGNNPVTGTATVSPDLAMGTGPGARTVGGQAVDPEERLRQIELEEERLRVERDSLSSQLGSSDGEDGEAKYRSLTVPKLQDEISRRNADRDETDAIEPDSQRKDDLVAALVEDDELQSERASQPVE